MARIKWHPTEWFVFANRYPGKCSVCGTALAEGESIHLRKNPNGPGMEAKCIDCPTSTEKPRTEEQELPQRPLVAEPHIESSLKDIPF